MREVADARGVMTDCEIAAPCKLFFFLPTFKEDRDLTVNTATPSCGAGCGGAGCDATAPPWVLPGLRLGYSQALLMQVALPPEARILHIVEALLGVVGSHRARGRRGGERPEHIPHVRHQPPAGRPLDE